MNGWNIVRTKRRRPEWLNGCSIFINMCFFYYSEMPYVVLALLVG